MTMTVHKEQMSTYIIIFSTHNKCLSSLVIRFPLNNFFLLIQLAVIISVCVVVGAVAVILATVCFVK